MKIAIILGTRPEIIKMSPVIRECERSGLDYYILHTGQHYSFEMDRVFFEELKLPAPKYNLDVVPRIQKV
jgi:UDP-N-acetylglucosamine 2-epimerase (non-hydrolysing)